MTQLLWTDVENIKYVPNVNSVLFSEWGSFVVSGIFNTVVKELTDACSLTFHVTPLRQCTKYFFLSDINELSLPKTCLVDFPDPDDLLNFKLIISPDEVIHNFLAPHRFRRYLRIAVLEHSYSRFHVFFCRGFTEEVDLYSASKLDKDIPMNLQRWNVTQWCIIQILTWKETFALTFYGTWNGNCPRQQLNETVQCIYGLVDLPLVVRTSLLYSDVSNDSLCEIWSFLWKLLKILANTHPLVKNGVVMTTKDYEAEYLEHC